MNPHDWLYYNVYIWTRGGDHILVGIKNRCPAFHESMKQSQCQHFFFGNCPGESSYYSSQRLFSIVQANLAKSNIYRSLHSTKSPWINSGMEFDTDAINTWCDRDLSKTKCVFHLNLSFIRNKSKSETSTRN